MRELEKSDRNSKSLMANVLDLEGDFILAPGGKPLPNHPSRDPIWTHVSNTGYQNDDVLEKELRSILLEIRVITDKIKDEVSFT